MIILPWSQFPPSLLMHLCSRSHSEVKRLLFNCIFCISHGAQKGQCPLLSWCCLQQWPVQNHRTFPWTECLQYRIELQSVYKRCISRNAIFCFSVSVVFSGMAISPRNTIPGNAFIAQPGEAGLPEYTTLASFLTHPYLYADIKSFFICGPLGCKALGNDRRSILCTQSKFAATAAVLLRCIWPIKCHSSSRSASCLILSTASCR